MKVFLIVAEPSTMNSISLALRQLGGEPVHSFACAVPWAGSANQLRSFLLPVRRSRQPLVVAELLGDWAAA